VKQATVTGIDLDKRRVSFAEMRPVLYDYLVLGLGATVNFFGVPGAAKNAFPMYTLPDAVRLKEHVLERWAAADRDPDLIEDGALNVVIVGAGPTGVESAGALAELYRQNLARTIPTSRRIRRGSSSSRPGMPSCRCSRRVCRRTRRRRSRSAPSRSCSARSSRASSRRACG
jgi:NADH dehydrogenase FAD-containing subunit